MKMKRDWSDASTSQGRPKTGSKPPEVWGRGLGTSPPRKSQKEPAPLTP